MRSSSLLVDPQAPFFRPLIIKDQSPFDIIQLIVIRIILSDPAAFQVEMDHIVGASGYVGRTNGLRVRNKKRRYQSTGIQGVVEAGFHTGSVEHIIELSARYHEDEEDRFQNDKIYQMSNGRMHLTSAGAPGSNSNRLGEAHTWSFVVENTMRLGSLTLTPGLRYETIDLKRTDWAGSDPDRAVPTRMRKTSVDVWIPGIATALELSPGIRFIVGAHRGFASPGPGSSAGAETSWNYEAGAKLSHNG